MRTLIVGEAPNRSGRGGPIAGRCGEKLASYAGLSLDEFLRTFDRVNVLTKYPGPAPSNGAAFPSKRARQRATDLRRRFFRGRRVVLLGRRAASAFGVKADYFDQVNVFGAEVVVVPHPSGINRWYNKPSNVAKMRRFMRQLAR